MNTDSLGHMKVKNEMRLIKLKKGPMKTLVLVLAITIFFAVSSASRAETPDSRLAGINKIFIGDLGKSDQADRFRLVLEDQLSANGFTVVDDESNADAVLSGIFTLIIEDKKEVARATLRLKLPSGERIWGGEFRPGFSWRGSSDMTKRVAMTVANKLKQDRDSATKKS